MAGMSRHRRDRHVERLLPGNRRQVSVDGQSGNPREPLTRKHERPFIALFARHARVHKDVLELARAPSTRGPEPKARPAEADPQLEAAAKVDGVAVVAARAAGHLE